jgi:LAO/AO transport system kinase
LTPDDEALARAIQGEPDLSQRRAVAKAITLVESTRDDHRARADNVLSALRPAVARSVRLGISGVPGVGKSTLIESLGLHLVQRGHRVAVLTVDPSSSVSGGSILGDKTRMERLSMHERAFIRPSPTAGVLGGVAERTREAVMVLEAAGHDVVIIETVGVGQSEAAVANMADVLVLLMLADFGDDLQSIKKGVLELADLVAINKADVDRPAAARAQVRIAEALRLLKRDSASTVARTQDRGQRPNVLLLSAQSGEGLPELWQSIMRINQTQIEVGEFLKRRQAQDTAWMWERIEAGLKQRFRRSPAVSKALPTLTEDVRAGRVAAPYAATKLLELFLDDGHSHPATEDTPGSSSSS